jgi:uncharacterized protein (TIGR02118 family)
MNFKAVILLSRRKDMSEEQFRNWWLNEHAPFARQLPGVRKIVFNVCDDTTEIDGISELWFDSEAEFVSAYETDLGKRVAADSLAHVRSRTRLFVSEKVVVSEVL